MRIRVVITGIIAGIVLGLVLLLSSFVFRNLNGLKGGPTVTTQTPIPMPSIGPDGEVNVDPVGTPSKWPRYILISIICLMLFISGWVAARWNWSRTWNTSFLSGAGSGLIAGALAFCFSGLTYVTTFGYLLFLASMNRLTLFPSLFLLPVEVFDFSPFLLAILSGTVFSVYQACVICLLGGALFGAFGGLASMLIDRNDVWGNPVSVHDSWLFRLSGYYLAINGLLNIVITIVITSKLDGVIAKWLEETNLSLQKPQSVLETLLSFFFAAMMSFLLYIIPSLTTMAIGWKVFSVDLLLAMTWGWTLRDWFIERERSIFSGFWVLISLGSVVYWIFTYTVRAPVNMFGTSIDFAPKIVFPLLSVAAHLFVIGIAVLIGWNIKRTPKDKSVPYRFGDWLGHLLTCTILGGVQMMTGIIVYAVPMAQIIVSGSLINGDPRLITILWEQITLLNNYHLLLPAITGITLVVLGINAAFALIFLWLTSFFRNLFRTRKKFSAISNLA